MSIQEAELERLVEDDAEVDDLDLPRDVRQAVSGHRAIRERLRRAMRSTQAGMGLHVHIQAMVAAALSEQDTERRRTPLSFPRWGMLASAAVVLVLLSAMFLFRPGEASTESGLQGKEAQAVLAHIHAETSTHPSHPNSNWTELRGYLTESTGIAPLRAGGAKLSLVGGAATDFFGETSASYVLQTPDGPVTFVVMRMHPEKLNFDRCRKVNSSRIWACGFHHHKMVAIRVGDLTYCAIGRFDHGRLSDLLKPVLTRTSRR